MTRWLSCTLRFALVLGLGGMALGLLIGLGALELNRLAPEVFEHGTAARQALTSFFTILQPVVWFGPFLAFVDGVVMLLRVTLRLLSGSLYAG